MLKIKTQSIPVLFYLGTLISSIGSATFTTGIIAFMLQAGYGLFDASLIVGLSRLLPIITSTLIGQKTDKLSAKFVVLFTEIGAAIGSLGILWGWGQGKPGYWILLLFSLFRAILMSFQIGSRARIVKELAEPHYNSQSRHAVLLNQVTQGAVVFAGILGWFAIRYLNFKTIILFDASTFIINGIILFCLPVGETQRESSVSKITESIFKKFKDLYKYNPRAALLDAALAFVMMGTASFTSRLAGKEQEWLAIFITSYGLSVWISGYLEHKTFARKLSTSVWCGLGLSYILLGFIPEQGFFTWGVCLAKDLCYWLLFHRISAYIQADTPVDVIASVNHARMAQMVTILALGEISVGAWQSVLPIALDGMWRGIFCIGIALIFSLKTMRVEYGYDRPTL